MSKKAIVIAVLLAVVVLSATLWFGMRLGERNAEQGTAGSHIFSGSKNIPSAVPARTTPLPMLNPAAPPPWAESSSGPNGAMAGVQGPAQIERKKQMAELKAMQMALMKSMQETHRADPKQVDALLLKIKQVTGSSTVNGVDIDALRGNLARGGEMQRIAGEMNREATRPGGADPKKIKAYTEQLQALQRQAIASPILQSKAAAGPAK
jgi:hypothetical protein